jgi:hypothetical protein
MSNLWESTVQVLAVQLSTNGYVLWLQEGDQKLDEAVTFLTSLPDPLSPFMSTVLLLMHQTSKVSNSDLEPNQ